MLHPPKPSAPATLPSNTNATPAPTTDAMDVNRTVHPDAADTSADATATSSQPIDHVPSDAAMSDATAAAGSEQPESVPSTNPHSNLVGADHITGPFAARTVGSRPAVGRDNVPQGKDLGVIGEISGKMSDAPGLLSRVPASAAPLQRALGSSTYAASTATGLPVNVSLQGKAVPDQAAGSGPQDRRKNGGELVAQTGPMSLGGSPGSVVQEKKRKVPEATGDFLTPHVVFLHPLQDCWLHSLPLVPCCVIILEANLPCQDFWLHILPLFLCWVISAEANLPCLHIQDCWLLDPLLLSHVNIQEASSHTACGHTDQSVASLVLTWFDQ